MSLHGDAAGALEGWAAPDPGQDALRRDYLAHLRAHEDGHLRSCPAGAHLTASALVVDAPGERVLLTLHPKVGRWLQLGGHCEPGDATLAEAALREAREESGIEGLTLLPGPARLDRHDVRCGGGRATHLDVQYVAIAAPGALEVTGAESLALGWFPAGALPPGTDDSVRRLVARALPALPAG